MTESPPEEAPELRAKRSWVRLKPSVARSLAVFAVSRAVVLLAAWGAAVISKSDSLLDVFSRWDGGWYLAIVRNGYPSQLPTGSGPIAQSNIAFFPGYPLLIKGASLVTGLSSELCGVAISLLAGAGMMVVFWKLTARLTDPHTADRTVLLFCFFPPSFVFSMVYSEGLFLLLAALCLLALLDQRWLVAGLSAAAASAVRANGLVLFACCAWAAIAAIRQQRRWRALVAPVLAPIGALSYFAYLYVHTGDALAYFHAENQGWNKHLDFGISEVREVYHAILFSDMRAATWTALVLGAATLVVGYVLWRWKPPTPILIYVCGVLGLLLLTSNPMSMPRFFLDAFPIAIPMAMYSSERSFPVLVGVCGALMTTLFLVAGASQSLAP